jgi:SAM-dependent methyltransferase
MDAKTVSHYDTHAREQSSRYESANLSPLYTFLLQHLTPRGASVLELGCGSGRDAAFLLANGYDLTGIDASAGMVAEATRIHPELAGRVSCAAVPVSDDSPLLLRTFDAVLSIAMFMHIPDPDLPTVVLQVRGLVRPGGALILDVSVGHAGLKAGRDARGRLFLERTPEEYRRIFEHNGFNFAAQRSTVDSLSRPYLRWVSLVFHRT